MTSTVETIQLPHPQGGCLIGSFCPADSTGDVVVSVHGFGSARGGNKAVALRRACALRGWTWAAFDFRGHGDSSGKLHELTGTRLQEDLAVVRDFLVQNGAKRLYLCGSSMGGWASAWFARTHPHLVAGLVLIAPAFRFIHRRWEECSEAERLEWQRIGRRLINSPWLGGVELGYALVEERNRFDPVTLTGNWQTPTLIFHGMKDDTVPYRDTLEVVEAIAQATVEVRLFRDGDHRLDTRADLMAEEACRFFTPRIQSEAFDSTVKG